MVLVSASLASQTSLSTQAKQAATVSFHWAWSSSSMFMLSSPYSSLRNRTFSANTMFIYSRYASVTWDPTFPSYAAKNPSSLPSPRPITDTAPCDMRTDHLLVSSPYPLGTSQFHRPCSQSIQPLSPIGSPKSNDPIPSLVEIQSSLEPFSPTLAPHGSNARLSLLVMVGAKSPLQFLPLCSGLRHYLSRLC
uniref:Uncharacterized protein n=1 Tax=Oryza nivara TaxID=4536 RepID=A0A0E0GM26_ORYNI